MNKKLMGWRETFFLENIIDIFIWILICIIFIVLTVKIDSSGAYSLVFQLSDALGFLAMLAVIFVLRKCSYVFSCGKCLKRVHYPDKHCRHCGENFDKK